MKQREESLIYIKLITISSYLTEFHREILSIWSRADISRKEFNILSPLNHRLERAYFTSLMFLHTV